MPDEPSRDEPEATAAREQADRAERTSGQDHAAGAEEAAHRKADDAEQGGGGLGRDQG